MIDLVKHAASGDAIAQRSDIELHFFDDERTTLADELNRIIELEKSL